MEFKFETYAKPIGKRKDLQYYEWKVMMKESPDLDKVAAVEYRLDPSFPDPIRLIKDHDSKFALRTSGWGNFTIYITVYLKDGKSVDTSHYLDLKNALGIS